MANNIFGTNPNQIPRNFDLGTMAYQDATSVKVENLTIGSSNTNTLTINSTAVSIPNNLNIDSGTLFIDAANNNVGIGTTTTDAKLTVNGGPITQYGGSANTYSGIVARSGTSSSYSVDVRMIADGANSPNKGLLGTGTNHNLSIITNGIGRAIFDTSGNMGIGTTSPSRKLHVYGGVDGDIIGQFQNGSGSTSHICFSNTGSNVDQVRIGSSGGDLLLSTNYTERLRIDSSGNVGIGVIPTSWNGNYRTFEIGNGGIYSTFWGSSNGDGGENSYGQSGICNNLKNGTVYAGNGSASYYTQSGGRHSWYTSGSTPGVADASVSWSRLMLLDAGGNVALGNAAATANLSFPSVVGNKIDFYYNVGAGDRYGIQVQSSELRIHSGAGGVSTGGITFGKDNGTTFTEHMRIQNGGNVGIGTSSPGYALEVHKQITIRGNNSSGTEYQDWPDCSFNIRRSDNYVQNGITMASFGYRSDATYFTDNSVCNIRIWDGSQPANASNSASTTKMTLGSPGSFSIITGNSTERFFIDSSGNVGVGVSPSAKFQVGGTSSNEVCIFRNTQTADNSFGYITVGGSGGSGGIIGQVNHTTTTSQRVFIGNLGDDVAGGVGLTVMRGSGNVGIGTSSPGNRLHVNGDAHTRVRINGTSTAGVYFTHNDADAGTIRGSTSGIEIYAPSAGLSMLIDSSGIVKKYNQPAFLVHGGLTGYAPGNGVTYTVDWQNADNNTGSYNTTTSTFTAPIAGWYLFHVEWLNYPNTLGSGEYFTSWITKNDVSYGNGTTMARYDSIKLQTTCTITQLYYLNVGDYVKHKVLCSTNTTIYNASGHGAFFGYFLG